MLYGDSFHRKSFHGLAEKQVQEPPNKIFRHPLHRLFAVTPLSYSLESRPLANHQARSWLTFYFM